MGIKLSIRALKWFLYNQRLLELEAKAAASAASLQVAKASFQVAEAKVKSRKRKLQVAEASAKADAEAVASYKECGDFAIWIALGLWDLKKSENYENYLEKTGVGRTLSTVGNNIESGVEFRKLNGDYSLKTFGTIKDTVVKFELNKEFDETTIDGREVKTVFTTDGNILVQTQKATKPNERDSVITREVQGDKLVTKLKCEDVEALRTYKYRAGKK